MEPITIKDNDGNVVWTNEIRNLYKLNVFIDILYYFNNRGNQFKQYSICIV